MLERRALKRQILSLKLVERTIIIDKCNNNKAKASKEREIIGYRYVILNVGQTYYKQKSLIAIKDEKFGLQKR